MRVRLEGSFKALAGYLIKEVQKSCGCYSSLYDEIAAMETHHCSLSHTHMQCPVNPLKSQTVGSGYGKQN